MILKRLNPDDQDPSLQSNGSGSETELYNNQIQAKYPDPDHPTPDLSL